MAPSLFYVWSSFLFSSWPFRLSQVMDGCLAAFGRVNWAVIVMSCHVPAPTIDCQRLSVLSLYCSSSSFTFFPPLGLSLQAPWRAQNFTVSTTCGHSMFPS